jgi:hypothetical protein
MLQDIDETMILFGKLQPIAKKEHKCSHCTVNIKIGEKYNKRFMVAEDGTKKTVKYHIICPWELSSFILDKL